MHSQYLHSEFVRSTVLRTIEGGDIREVSMTRGVNIVICLRLPVFLKAPVTLFVHGLRASPSVSECSKGSEAGKRFRDL
jgi:hypothetical protein